MAIAKTDIKVYLTSIEPSIAQTIYSQSLGGYKSASLLYTETTLLRTIGLYDTNIRLNNYVPVTGSQYLNIGLETIKVEAVASNSVNVVSRGLRTSLSSHVAGSVVRGMADEFFNNDMTDDLKQYRCVAIKNNSATEIAYQVRPYIKMDTQNTGSTIKLAVEIPNSDYLTSTASDWDYTSLEDTSLGTTYSDNHFTNALLRITSGPNSGQTRVIASYDQATNKFVFSNAMPNGGGTPATITYTIDPGPAQRISTGTETPIFGSGRVSALEAATASSSLGINVNNIGPNDLFYLWIERALTKNADASLENTSIITLFYSTS